ncbi:phosphatase PAP2 family protein [Idiomarina piscisalsi]|uniref:undecaprenyl-diphosphate phosphatase n=1 Tax=Idiomarina piscisalsi TaxID=1096243 RepID=A0ABN5ARP2_9GAMM|nr:phosphatase PAP2 family protein [Idiomarina piscisalsi]ASG65372.1 phosphatase PAP2 family protein [Idiomarina piscisalsi]MTJ02336.1 phosphatase PAP2 family protein [Idiomarina piscisalsi]
MVLLSYLQRFDTYCYCLFSGIRARPVAGRFAVWVSRSGDGYAYFAIALSSVLLHDSGTAYFKHLLLAFLIELPIYWLLKSSFKRRRPSDLGLSLAALIVASDKFSFPSGHTAAAFIFAGITGLHFPDFGFLCYVWASAIGFSRVIVGVHFPSDIVAGALLAMFIWELVL